MTARFTIARGYRPAKTAIALKARRLVFMSDGARPAQEPGNDAHARTTRRDGHLPLMGIIAMPDETACLVRTHRRLRAGYHFLVP